MEIKYTYDDQVAVTELFSLLDQMTAFQGDRFPARNVFHTALRDQDKEQVSLDNTIAVTARQPNGTMVGYLRILTDRAYMFYILDVMVAPGVRGLGIGSRLVELAVKTSMSRGFIKIFLTAIPGSEGFYKRFGFKESMSPVLTLRGEDYVKA